MKNPTCSVPQLAYDEGERTPMLLHCGHGFCRDFETLKNNFLVLSLIHDNRDFSDEEDRPWKRRCRWVQDGILRDSR
ncbi:hypothetical protein AMTRI_Chr01g131350 [Amborella trichopoda]